MPYLPAMRSKKSLCLGKAGCFQSNTGDVGLQNVDQDLQQALHTGADNDLFGAADNAAGHRAVFGQCTAQFCFTLRLAIARQQVFIF